MTSISLLNDGSISKATTQLNLAQATLSPQLKQKEGHKVLSYARMIFDIGQKLKDRIVNLSHEGRPHIHIGISKYVAKTMVDIFQNCILEYEPNTYIYLEKDKMDKLIQNLEDHLIDIILTDTPNKIYPYINPNLLNKEYRYRTNQDKRSLPNK